MNLDDSLEDFVGSIGNDRSGVGLFCFMNGEMFSNYGCPVLSYACYIAGVIFVGAALDNAFSFCWDYCKGSK